MIYYGLIVAATSSSATTYDQQMFYVAGIDKVLTTHHIARHLLSNNMAAKYCFSCRIDNKNRCSMYDYFKNTNSRRQ